MLLNLFENSVIFDQPPNQVNIDNVMFRAHYKITTAILFICCLLATAEYLGQPINCLFHKDSGLNSDSVNTYCWIAHTFTIPSALTKKVGTEVISPGVTIDHNNEKPKYHSYYQWVPFVLFLQGVLFYIPRWIWRQWEDGKMQKISDGLRGHTLDSEDKRKIHIQQLIEYMYGTLHQHNGYAAKYFFCEVLNFVNVVFNFFLTDLFLQGDFMDYGWKVLHSWNQEKYDDPMVKIFPRMTKCTFHKFGAGGSVQNHDALCILSNNILNEKIYLILWCWFVLLVFMSGAALIYSMAIIVFHDFRKFIIKKAFKFEDKADAKALVRKIQVGDFLLIYLLGQNIDNVHIKSLLEGLVHFESNRYNDTTSLRSTTSKWSLTDSLSQPDTLETLKLEEEMII